VSVENQVSGFGISFRGLEISNTSKYQIPVYMYFEVSNINSKEFDWLILTVGNWENPSLN